MNLARMIDHTTLKPEASLDQIEKLCNEGKKYGFCSICVNPVWVSYCVKTLKESGIRVCSVSGFPLGANKKETKIKEAEMACQEGADEVDMVMNIGALKSGDLGSVEEEIKGVRKALGGERVLKVIIETCVLTDEEKIRAAKIVMDCGADFVKTSTGFNRSGATYQDVKLLKEVVKDKIKVKASGGIRDYPTALKMIQAGADRIGTSSGVKIIEEMKKL
ncbi:MAG: deoxyribose-phosphate aldolase, partial [Candidatus Zixiibacteriota bacterium]